MTVIFSDKTYQVQVEDTWIFLQFGDDGKPIDRFCGCDEASREGKCSHIEKALLLILDEKGIPLHQRFRDSLIHDLFFLAARRHGYEAQFFSEKSGSYSLSMGGRELMRLSVEEDQVKEVEQILYNRPVETEETSLKFSNLSKKERELYRKGRPSDRLQYELSVFSDLAKWMFMQEGTLSLFCEELTTLPLRWTFLQGKARLELLLFPSTLPLFLFRFYEVDPTLPIYPYRHYDLSSATYQEKEGILTLSTVEKVEPFKGESIPLREWEFFEGQGFVKREIDPLFEEKFVSKERLGWVLSRYFPLLDRFLDLQNDPKEFRYALSFDPKGRLKVEAYLFEEGDLFFEGSHLYVGWVHIAKKGFFPRLRSYFHETVFWVEKEEVVPFIEKHRAWLASQKGFSLHFSHIEAKMSYRVEENHLVIEPMTEADQEMGVIDFGHWVYVNLLGFYPKGRGESKKSIKEKIPKEEIAAYIRENREECESIRGFFLPKERLKKTSLSLFVEGSLPIDQQIRIQPNYELDPPASFELFKEFIYLHQEGFIEIPPEYRLPDRYQETLFIRGEDVPYFLTQELFRMQSFIGYLDPKLRTPKSLKLVLIEAKKGKGKWLLRFVYRSEWGDVPLHQVDLALKQFKQYFFSPAGLLSLRDSKFQWLQQRTDVEWISLTPLEWLKLKLFENVEIDLKESVDWIDFLDASLETRKDPDLSLLKSELRPYQVTGARWLYHLYQFGFSGLLCDDMGLGKTHQAMSTLAFIKKEKELRGEKALFLVVAPTSVIYHWERLLQTFVPSLKVQLHHGQGRSLENLDCDLIVTSYGILRSDKALFKSFDFDLAIFDEMQIAKNQSSLIHKALLAIHARMRLGLSGTPIENRLLELKSLMDIILPKFLPTENVFKEFFVNPIEKEQNSDRGNLLMGLVKPFILRRKKKDVLLDLPDKIEECLFVDLSDEQKELYKSLYLSSKQSIEADLASNERNHACIHIFALLTKLKQVCNHPSLILGDLDRYQEHQSGKWDLFVELLSEARSSSQKVVVFSQFLDMLSLIERYLEEEGIGYASIRGSTQNRRGEVDRFQNDPLCEVFVGSIHAAGVGIDLTQASCVIHYDRWWNFAKENQATDRVHRIGQTRGVQVFKIISKETIEEDIDQLIRSKERLAEQILGYDSIDEEKQLSQEELIRLMNKLEHSIQLMG